MAANTKVAASASLYVGSLNSDVAEAMLFERFNGVGPVASVRVCRDSATRRSLGYAYVNFHRVEDASRALELLNYTDFKGRQCRIMWSHRDPALRKSGAGNIFIKNLNKTITSKQLKDTFSKFGDILSCKVATTAGDNPSSLGYGFVHFDTDAAAQSAISSVNGKIIAGEKVTVELFRPKKDRGDPSASFTNVYVKNLPADFTKEQLQTTFGEFGEIKSFALRTATIPAKKAAAAAAATAAAATEEGTEAAPAADAAETKVTPAPRAFGFVDFASHESAVAAIDALNGKDINEDGVVLFVGRAQKKAERAKALQDKYLKEKAERQRQLAGVNLYVKNLPDTVDDEKLREEFKQFGNITSTRIMRDESGKSRGFGFVCFSEPDEATRAVNDMNDRTVFDQKPLFVALAERKEVRRAHLEAQMNARNKMNMGHGRGPIYNQGQGPMFHQPMQRMMYPHQMPMWPNGAGPQGPMALMGNQGRGNFQLMPAEGGRQGGRQQQPRRMGNPQQANGRGRQGNVAPNKNNRAAPQAQGQEAAPAVGVQLARQLAEATPDERRQMIGEQLFPRVAAKEQQFAADKNFHAAKITGMLLEMEDAELLHLLESDEALNEKVGEALGVLGNEEAEEATA